MSYGEIIQSWHDCYLATGTAAATLVGLLFVGLSLHIEVVVSHADVRSLARVTLTDFVAVLLVSLAILSPAIDERDTAAWLISVAVVSFVLVAQPALHGVTDRRAVPIRIRVLISRFGLSALCFVGVALAALLLAHRDAVDALNGLRIVVVVLLVIAVRNTWDLLVSVAESASMADIR